MKPHYVGSIEVTKRPIFVRGAVSLRALVPAGEPENRFWALYFWSKIQMAVTFLQIIIFCHSFFHSIPLFELFKTVYNIGGFPPELSLPDRIEILTFQNSLGFFTKSGLILSMATPLKEGKM